MAKCHMANWPYGEPAIWLMAKWKMAKRHHI